MPSFFAVKAICTPLTYLRNGKFFIRQWGSPRAKGFELLTTPLPAGFYAPF